MTMRQGPAACFTCLLLGVLAAAGCGRGGDPAPTNVLVVVVDTLRRDHVGSYGYERATTPNLDARAGGGLVVERCVAQAPWTAASMASIFTSRIPSETGVGALEDSTGVRHLGTDACSALAGEQTTLAEVLRAADFQTVAVTTNPFLAPQFGIVQGFDTHVKGQLTARGVVDSALAWLRDPEACDARRPFFLYLHFMDVHVPNEPPGDFRFMFPTLDGQKHRREHSRGDQVSRENTDPQALRVFRSHKVALYDGSVAYVDQQLERLLNYLEESGQLARTLVVFTADHGEGLYDRNGVGHGTSMHCEETDIPLILFGPGVPAGRVDELASGLDIAPTILDLAGVEIPGEFDGHSLLGSREREHAAIVGLSEDVAYGREQKSLEVEGWKVIVDHEGRPTGLYDRIEDPGERQNLLAEDPGRASTLAAQLHAILVGAGNREREVLEIDDATREQLRTLGY